MSPAKEEVMARAQQRAASDRQVTFLLGLVMHTGMVEIEMMERFAGADLSNVYETHFPMPDGAGEWEFTLRRKAPQ